MFICDIQSKDTGDVYPLHVKQCSCQGAYVWINLIGTDVDSYIMVTEAGLVQDMQDFISIYEEHLKQSIMFANIECTDGEMGLIWRDWQDGLEEVNIQYWSPQRGYLEKVYVADDFDCSVDAMVGKFCEEYLSK